MMSLKIFLLLFICIANSFARVYTISITFHYLLIFASTITLSKTVCSLGDLNLNHCLKTEISNRFIKLHNSNKGVPFDTINPFWFNMASFLLMEMRK